MPVKRIITYIYLLIFNINYSYITPFYAIMRSYYAIYKFRHIDRNNVFPFSSTEMRIITHKKSPPEKGELSLFNLS